MVELLQTFENILGVNDEKINAQHMAARVVVVFFTGLVYARIAGIRIFGKKTIFEQITALILGTLLGNAIFNPDVDFFSLMFAAFIFVVLNRMVAIITFLSSGMGRIIKGEPIQLIKDGVLLDKNMLETLITRRDIEEGLRGNGFSSFDEIAECYLERSGQMSFVKKEKIRGHEH